MHDPKELANIACLALNFSNDSPVAFVSHPAYQTQLVGHHLRFIAEANALDTPGKTITHSDRRRFGSIRDMHNGLSILGTSIF